MKFQSYIINKLIFGQHFVVTISIFLLTVYCSIGTVYAHKIALITSEKNSISEKLSNQISEKVKFIDTDLSTSALRATAYDNIYNLTTVEAKRIGTSIGCDFFVILRSETLIRSYFQVNNLYESFAVIYLISAKSGHLIFWRIYKFEDKNRDVAEQKLLTESTKISTDIKQNLKIDNYEKPSIFEFEENDKTVRSPLPFKRLKPIYTTLANMYSVTATVDIEVDLNEKGEIIRTEILRWAGFGLDESVIDNVRKMNWRPAEKDGKTLLIRVLLRYNFKKAEN